MINEFIVEAKPEFDELIIFCKNGGFKQVLLEMCQLCVEIGEKYSK